MHALTKGKRRGPARNPVLTRQRLLDAATAEFALKGLEGGRVARIAEKAGLNKQLVYHYFGSKEKLYTQVLEDAYTRLRAAQDVVDLAMPPREAIRRLVVSVFDSATMMRDVTALLVDENFHFGRHIRTSIKIKALHHEFLGQLTTVLRRGQREGVFAKRIDPIQLFMSILALTNIYMRNMHTLSAAFEKDLADPREMKRWRRHIVDFVLKALRPGSTPDQRD